MRDAHGAELIASGVGYASLALMWLGLVLGLVLRDGRALDHMRPVTLAAMHQSVTACGFSLAIVHALSQLAVPGGPTSLLDVLIPFTHRVHPVGVGFGVLAVELVIAIGVVTALRDRFGYHRWRMLHRFGYLAFSLLALHVVVVADHRSWWLRGVILVGAAVTVGYGLWTAGWISRLPYVVAAMFAAPSRRARRVSIHVDNTRCTRFGFCQHEAPELFELRASGRLKYSATATADEVDAAIRAARSCPTRAIVLSRQAVRVVVAEPPSEDSAEPSGESGQAGDQPSGSHGAGAPASGRNAEGRHAAADAPGDSTTDDGKAEHAPTA